MRLKKQSMRQMRDDAAEARAAAKQIHDHAKEPLRPVPDESQYFRGALIRPKRQKIGA